MMLVRCYQDLNMRTFFLKEIIMRPLTTSAEPVFKLEVVNPW